MAATLRLLCLAAADRQALRVRPVPPVLQVLLLRALLVLHLQFPALPVRKVALGLLAQRVPPATHPRFRALREVQALPELRLPAQRVPPVQPALLGAADLQLL